MMAPTHALTGVGAFSLVAVSAGLPLSGAAIALAVIGALLPDIDHPGSWLGRRTFPFSLLFGWFVGHRGITHSALAFVLVTALAVVLGGASYPHLVLPLCIGYLSHLFADWNTSAGIPVFWPLKQRFCAPWSFDTGSLVELSIGATFTALFALILWRDKGYADLETLAVNAGQAVHGLFQQALRLPFF